MIITGVNASFMTQKDFEHIEEIINGLNNFHITSGGRGTEAQDISASFRSEKWRSSNHMPLQYWTQSRRTNSVHDCMKRIFQAGCRQCPEGIQTISSKRIHGARAGERTERETHRVFQRRIRIHESFRFIPAALAFCGGSHKISERSRPSVRRRQPVLPARITFSSHFRRTAGQYEHYPVLDPQHLPVTLVTDSKNEPVTVHVEIGHSNIAVQAYRLLVRTDCAVSSRHEQS